jgi:hypothetical protein
VDAVTSVSTGPEPLDWTVYAGDRNRIRFMFQSGGDPWDITGAVLSAQARISATDPTVALTATCEVTEAVSGAATVAWDGEAVRTLLAEAETWVGVWDLQILEEGETLPLTVYRGKLTATMDVTKPVIP